MKKQKEKQEEKEKRIENKKHKAHHFFWPGALQVHSLQGILFSIQLRKHLWDLFPPVANIFPSQVISTSSFESFSR